jgi:hypothetical protein
LQGEFNAQDPHARAQIHLLGKKLAQAQRFELDTEFTQFAGSMSYHNPKHLGFFYTQAKAPYDLTWIEWSPEQRQLGAQRYSESHGWEYTFKSDNRDTHGGMLIERDDRFPGRDSIYRVSMFTAGRDTKTGRSPTISGWPTSLIFDTDGGDITPCVSSQDLILGSALHSQEQWRLLYAFSPGWFSKYGTVRKTKEGEVIDMPDEYLAPINYMKESASYGCNGAFGQWFIDYIAPAVYSSLTHMPTQWKRQEYKQEVDKILEYISKHMPWAVKNERKLTEEKFKLVVDSMLVEGAGDLRWAATVLGLLNTYQTQVSEPMAHGELGKSREINLKKLPYLEYRRLSLVLPKGKPIDYRVKDFHRPTGLHHRAHLVRGHYRNYKATNRHDAFKTWVKPHQRGDAALGWVIKTYHVEKDPNAT